MKIVKQLACGVLAAACAVGFIGCKDKSSSDKSSSKEKEEEQNVDVSKVDASKPKVANGFYLAAMVRAPENTSFAPLCKRYGLTVSDLIKLIPGQDQMVVQQLGVDKATYNWVSVSLGGEFGEDKTPDFAVALATNLDLDKFIAEDQKLDEGKADKAEYTKTTIAGVPAYEVVDKKLPTKLFMASLDGKLILVGSSSSILEKQLFLYCGGAGENSNFSSFGQDGNGVFCVKATEVGVNLKKVLPDPSMVQVVNGFIPEGDKLVLGLGTVDFAFGATPDGINAKLDITVETASEADAGKLVDLLKGLEKEASRAASRDESAKLVANALQRGKIEAKGKVVKFSSTKPAESLFSLISQSMK